MKRLLPVVIGCVLAALPGCASPDRDGMRTPHWAFQPEMIFPADRSLTRAEDGVALEDGRLIVADQTHGLRLIDRAPSCARRRRRPPPRRAIPPNPATRKDTVMFPIADPQLQRQLIADRHEALRRTAGHSRLRRQLRDERRRRRRTGPDR